MPPPCRGDPADPAATQVWPEGQRGPPGCEPPGSTHCCGTGHRGRDSARTGWGCHSAPSPSRFTPGGSWSTPLSPTHRAPQSPPHCHGGCCPSIWAPPGLRPVTQSTLGPSPPTQGAAASALISPRAGSPSTQGTQESPSPPEQPPFHRWGGCSLLPQGTQFCSPLGLPLSIWGGILSPPHCHRGCSPLHAGGLQEGFPGAGPQPRKAP